MSIFIVALYFYKDFPSYTVMSNEIIRADFTRANEDITSETYNFFAANKRSACSYQNINKIEKKNYPSCYHYNILVMLAKRLLKQDKLQSDECRKRFFRSNIVYEV